MQNFKEKIKIMFIDIGVTEILNLLVQAQEN